MLIRAKFRVLGIRAAWDDSHVLDAAPIMPRTKDWPSDENSVENAIFWNSTPSGRLEMTFKGTEPPWKPDDAIYIDLEPSDKGWELYKIGMMKDQVEVTFYGDRGTVGIPDKCVSAEFSMIITNRDAWPPFLKAGPGSVWSIVFTQAES